MKKISFVLYFIFQLGIIKGYTQNNNSPCNCCTENHRMFDFWIGNWQVYDSSGTFLGSNKIELMQDSCVLQEHWEGAKGSTGTSLSFYNRRSKLWHQTWVDKSGGVIMMKGAPQKSKIVMLTDKYYPNNSELYTQSKTTWYPLKDGRVHHVWEQTKDSGKSWVVVFDGYYQKKKK